MDLVELVEVGASCVEGFAGGDRLLDVRPDLREGVVEGKVGGALAKIVKRSNVSAEGNLRAGKKRTCL